VECPLFRDRGVGVKGLNKSVPRYLEAELGTVTFERFEMLGT